MEMRENIIINNNKQQIKKGKKVLSKNSEKLGDHT